MKTWQKIGIVIVTMGLSGGCSYCASLWPSMGLPIFAPFGVAISGIGTWLVGWPPKTEVK